MTARILEAGNIGPPVLCQLWVGNDYAAPFVYASGWGYNSINYTYSAGETIPNFRKRLRSGELLPMTNWLQYEVKAREITGKLRYAVLGGLHDYAYWDPIVPFTIDYFAPSKDSMLALASSRSIDYRDLVQAAAARIYSSGWDVGTFAAELKQVIEMFCGLVSKITNILRGWPPGTPWGLWLEQRYGWRTLSYDLDDLIKAIINIDDKRRRWRESCSTSETWEDVTSETVTSPAYNDSVVKTNSFKLSVRGTVAADIIPPKFQMNPFITYWEVTRFSFIVDWVLGMGQWLSAMSFLALSSEHVAAGGYQLTCDRTCVHTSTVNPGYIIQDGAVRRTASTAVLTMRTPQSISTFPQLRVKLDVTKLIDLVAIFLQLVNRRR